MTALAIYIEGVFYPQAKQIIGEFLQENYPHIVDIYLWEETLDRSIPMLALGKLPEVLPITYVKTLSQKQIMANPAALTDLRAAIDLLYEPRVYPPLEYKVVTKLTPAEEKALGPVLVVDIETGGPFKILLPTEMWLISLAINDGKSIYVFTEESLSPENPDNVIAQLIRIFQSGRKLVAHNMKFDFRIIGALFGIELKGHLCSMLLHHAINPGGKEHGLKETCRKYLGAPDWDAEAKHYSKGIHNFTKGTSKLLPDGYVYPQRLIDMLGPKIQNGYESIPRDLLYQYNAYDVYWTWYLVEYLTRAGVDERLAKLAKHEFNMSNFFQDVETTGAAVDEDYLEMLDTKYTADAIPILSDIRHLLGNPDFNPNSPKQVKEAFAAMGVSVPSTAEGVLEELLPTLGKVAAKFVQLLLEYRKIIKLHGTYVTGVRKRMRDGIVYPTFKVHGTNTGRLSAADPNIQNVPRDEDGKMSMRRTYIPRGEGRSLVSVDYSQAELRVMACMSNDEYLISLFQPGMPDFFDSLMPVAFPKVDLATIDKDTKKNLRANLKGVIYGMSYGRKEFAIAKALNMPVKDAKAIITNYFLAAPALYDWRQEVMAKAIDPGSKLETPFGRYYQSEVITSRNKQNVINSGLAFLPQSTASDICVVAAMDVHEQLKGTDSFIIATIHDAILMDVPDEDVTRVSDLTQRAMSNSALEIFQAVPFATEATAGKSWEGI